MKTPTDDAQVISLFEEHVNPALSQVMKFIGFDSVEVSAQGCIVRDSQGREFLDCLGGFGTLSLGHSHPRVVAAVKDQLDKMAFSSRVLFNEPQARLAARLAELAPGDLQFSFFCNSGAEAVEGALKMARLATGRTRIVSATGAYHGKTLGALSVSGRDAYKLPFAPLLSDCQQVPFNDAGALEAVVDERTAAVLLEPVQGEAGIIVPDDDYLRCARRICNRAGALLILDEVQTGLGRTGKWWGCDWSFENTDCAPDLMLLAKTLSGGVVPIGAILGTPPVWEIWRQNPLIHSSTFGGNPLACAAGLAALEVLEAENLIARCARAGELLKSALETAQAQFPALVRDVRGRGLLLGVEFSHPDLASLTVSALAQRGVIVAYTFNNPTVIRFEPPFTISDQEIEWATRAFEEALAQTAELIEGLLDGMSEPHEVREADPKETV